MATYFPLGLSNPAWTLSDNGPAPPPTVADSGATVTIEAAANADNSEFAMTTDGVPLGCADHPHSFELRCTVGHHASAAEGVASIGGTLGGFGSWQLYVDFNESATFTQWHVDRAVVSAERFTTIAAGWTAGQSFPVVVGFDCAISTFYLVLNGVRYDRLISVAPTAVDASGLAFTLSGTEYVGHGAPFAKLQGPYFTGVEVEVFAEACCTPGVIRNVHIEVCGEGPCPPFVVAEQSPDDITLADRRGSGWGE